MNDSSELPRPIIEADACKSCGRCVLVCPKHVLSISEHYNKRGVKHVIYAGSGCVGCGICFYNCPEPYAIRIEK